MATTLFPGHPLPVSKIILGTMMFGDKCDYPATEAIIRTALEQGINSLDTAAMYTTGVSEEFVGRAVQPVKREDLFITTKVVKGVDETSILSSIDESLARLQMEYVDLYLIHWPVPGMNLTEMMGALNKVVASGKTRLVGCCNFPAYLLAACNAIAAQHGWAKLSCNQVAYNLFERGIEVEILPQAVLENIAITAYRPLAIGLLTGKFLPGTPMEAATRGATDSRVITWLSQHGSAIKNFVQFARAHGYEPAELAVAWVLHNPGITSPILGVSSVRQVEAASRMTAIQLSDQEYQALTDLFNTEVKEEGLQLFPGLKYNFPRLRRNLNLLG
jgi:1-deoxyxylulose-5-phosphate synthase